MSAPCPICAEPGGFHHPPAHSTVPTPPDLARWPRGVERWMRRAKEIQGRRPDNGARSPDPAERAAFREAKQAQEEFTARMARTALALAAGEPVDPDDHLDYEVLAHLDRLMSEAVDAHLFGTPNREPDGYLSRPSTGYHDRPRPPAQVTAQDMTVTWKGQPLPGPSGGTVTTATIDGTDLTPYLATGGRLEARPARQEGKTAWMRAEFSRATRPTPPRYDPREELVRAWRWADGRAR